MRIFQKKLKSWYCRGFAVSDCIICIESYLSVQELTYDFFFSDHELEKQYLCTFCRKRFKNKNEAERHLTSLHLRPHSWSCAALSSYEAAFHPSTSSTDQTLNGSSYDACGFCGKEFPNLPAPEWNKRIDHLTVTHKFRECNHAKKFYRADHFRQHLKHSHAGTSGKWTNTLENACMKEEPIAEYGGGLASIGEQKPSIHYQRTSLRDWDILKDVTVDEVDVLWRYHFWFFFPVVCTDCDGGNAVYYIFTYIITPFILVSIWPLYNTCIWSIMVSLSIVTGFYLLP